MRNRNTQAGQSLILVAAGMIVLLGVMGLAIDLGYYRWVKRNLQAAADAAAIAGAIEVAYGDVTTAGQNASAENGYTNGSNGVTVTISQPPADPPFNSTSYPDYVEAKVTQTGLPTFFSGVLGLSAPTITAMAVAKGSLNCIYALDPNSGDNGVSLQISFITANCGVVDNSNLRDNFGGLCAPAILVDGTFPRGVNTGLFGGCPRNENAAPVAVTVPAADPFGYITPPSPLTTPCPGGGTDTVTNLGSVGAPFVVTQGLGCTVNITNSVVQINPGKYTKITIVGSYVTFAGGGGYVIGNTSTAGPALNIDSEGFGFCGGFIRGSCGSIVNFAPAQYNIVGGIQDCHLNGGVCNPSFGSFINFNTSGNTSNSGTLMILDGGFGGAASGCPPAFSFTPNPPPAGWWCAMELVGTTAIGNGVTFYNTGTTMPSAGTCSAVSTCYGSIVKNLSFTGAFCGGGTNCALNAPTGGGAAFPNFLYFQDRGNCASNVQCGNTMPAYFQATFSFGGSNTASLSGWYYFPKAPINFDFDFGFGATSNSLVAWDINWFFNFTFPGFGNNGNNQIRTGSAVLVQ